MFYMGKTNMKKVPAMTSSGVHVYLEELGSEWTGKGCAMELGCWLGASSIPLLKGLVKAGYNLPFWAMDRWWVKKDQVEKAAKDGFKLVKKQDSSLIYLGNVKPIYNKINAFRTELPGGLTNYTGDKIEILILDGPKRDPVFTDCMHYLLPYCIPGVTVIGLLDYHFWERLEGEKSEAMKSPVKFMKKYGHHFSLLKEWKVDDICAFFKYEKQISW